MTARRNNKETAVEQNDGSTQVVEGAVVASHDEPTDRPDAGLAQAEMDASTAAHEAADPGHLNDEQAVQDGWAEPDTVDGDKVPPLVESVETLLFHPQVTPRVKVLMLQMVWIGQPMTAEALASGTGLTKTEVFHALKRYVAAGIVTETMVPTTEPPWKFNRHYTITAEIRAWLADRLTRAAAADDAD